MLNSKIALLITTLVLYSLPYIFLTAGAVLLFFGIFANKLPKKSRTVSALIGSVLLLLFALTRIFIY